MTNTSVNVESMIGTLMMMGIVVSNSILLVDFANRMVRNGSTAAHAVLEAGRRRIRPILATALATILGLLPWRSGSAGQRNHGAVGPRGGRRVGGQHDHDAAGRTRDAQSGIDSSGTRALSATAPATSRTFNGRTVNDSPAPSGPRAGKSAGSPSPSC